MLKPDDSHSASSCRFSSSLRRRTRTSERRVYAVSRPASGWARRRDTYYYGYGGLYSNGSDDFYQIADTTGTDGNISAEPDYVDYDTGLDAEDWDLTLDTGSASIDAGTDADGSTADIGAYGGSGGSW
ncbi:MAG: hypothetical protein GY913_03200 [Proteobacteria bacterium]|nr:hypothetical protein [Pseudomonadota bacterium]MCP4915907.1 hypothetical protein [Pseudomonadota bacterium]